jgi:hypothetical protein
VRAPSQYRRTQGPKAMRRALDLRMALPVGEATGMAALPLAKALGVSAMPRPRVEGLG